MVGGLSSGCLSTQYKRPLSAVPVKMLRIMDRLTNVLLSASASALDYRVILDKNRCPLSGKPMTNPWTDLEGINYELGNITVWLTSHDYSPISRASLAVSDLLINRALKDVIEEALTMPAADLKILNEPSVSDIVMNRYVVTLHWSCNIDQAIDPIVYSQIKTKTAGMDNSDWWPAANDTSAVSEMTWFAFSALRNYVYEEFKHVLGAGTIDNFIRTNARDYFLDSMKTNYTKSKPVQIEFAIDRFCKRQGRQNTTVMQRERHVLWCKYFNLQPDTVPSIPPPPVRQITYQDTVPYTPQRTQPSYPQSYGYGNRGFIGLPHGHA